MFNKAVPRGIFYLPVVALLLLVAGGAISGEPRTGTTATASSVDKEQPFDCSRLREMGIDRQMNIRATQILAACQGRQLIPPTSSSVPGGPTDKAGLYAVTNKLNPLVYGNVDQNVILPDGTYPHTVQSETMVWGHGSTIVVNYNDSRAASSCYAGLSWSSDGGATWTRPGGTGASPLCTGHGTNFGDPIVVWNNALSMWFAGDLATGCGGQGVGMWTSPDGQTWTPGACAFSLPAGAGDRELMWVDNNPSSPYLGRMYVSFNNFGVGSGALQIVYSDDGTVWHAPITISNTATFMRDVQATGGPDGTVFVASLIENGGGLNPRQNVMFRSTDGGNTWTPSIMGPPFPAPGVAVTGYFALMFRTIWRHMGAGQPGVGPDGVVHYTYTQHGTGSDAGDQMYTRSTDNGSTWSTPILMNTEGGIRPQWQGNLAVTPQGAVLVSWYDGREAIDCVTPGANIPCYRRYGRVSLDNGATWQDDDILGDVMSPLPAQPDPNIQTVYEGDYDYSSADGGNAYTTWNDGRVLINGTSQQDVFFDKINILIGTPTPTATPCSPLCTSTPTPTPTRTRTRVYTPTSTATPTCNPNRYYYTVSTGATIVPGTTDTGNHTDDGTTQITLPFAFSLYGTSYITANVSSNGNMQFAGTNPTYTGDCLPLVTFTGPTIFPHWDDLLTTGTCPGGCGIFTSISGIAPNRIFNIEWRATYNFVTGNANFEIRLYEGTTQGRFDVILGQLDDGGHIATIGVQDGVWLVTQYECNAGANNDILIAWWQGCGTPMPTSTYTPSATESATYTPTPTITPTVVATFTQIPMSTSTLTPILTPTLVPTPCTTSFSDVYPSDYFYLPVTYLACHGVVSGYADNTFRPYNNTTRGQLSKIIVLAEGWRVECPQTGHFSDVLPGSAFYCYVETAYSRGVISGYGDGTFRPGNNVTRGQLCKIVVLAQAWADDCPSPGHFSDVQPGSAFFCFVETAYSHGIISGYADSALPTGQQRHTWADM